MKVLIKPEFQPGEFLYALAAGQVKPDRTAFALRLESEVKKRATQALERDVFGSVANVRSSCGEPNGVAVRQLANLLAARVKLVEQSSDSRSLHGIQCRGIARKARLSNTVAFHVLVPRGSRVRFDRCRDHRLDAR